MNTARNSTDEIISNGPTGNATPHPFGKGWAVALGAIQLFIGIGAVYGGIGLVSDPRGPNIGLPLDTLDGTPFSDFLIPGIVLLVFVGIGSLAGVLSLLFRRPHRGIFAVFLGIILMLWIGVQTCLVAFHWFQPLFFVLGMGEMMLGLRVNKGVLGQGHTRRSSQLAPNLIVRALELWLAGRVRFSRPVESPPFEDRGEVFSAFRKVVVRPTPGQPKDPGAVFQVRFSFRNLSATANRRLSLIPIPMIVAQPGFRSKTWRLGQQTGDFIGYYEFDTVETAEAYWNSLPLKMMRRRAAEGSLSHEVKRCS